MKDKNFSDLGRVEAIRLLFEGTQYDAFSSSEFIPEAGGLVVTSSRLFLEGIDFNLVYFPLPHLGYKCITSVAGELYASLGKPKSLDVTVGVSSKLEFGQIKELWSGIVSAATEHGFATVSLDLVPSKNGLSISVGAAGTVSAAASAGRPAPESRDLLCVSGSLGGAYLGMRILERAAMKFEAGDGQPDLEKYKMMVGSYLKPDIVPDLPRMFEDSGILPSAGCLVGRGLADAVKRLARQTGLGAKIYADKIPFEGNSFEFGKELDVDPVSAAMNGGEDYRLLYVIPILKAEKFRHDFQTFDIIGHLARPEVGTVLVMPEGAELPLRAQGWKDIEDE